MLNTYFVVDQEGKKVGGLGNSSIFLNICVWRKLNRIEHVEVSKTLPRIGILHIDKTSSTGVSH